MFGSGALGEFALGEIFRATADDTPAVVTPGGTVTVPASRTAKFLGRSRLVVFTSKAPVSLPKVPADELYYVGDFSKDLNDGATAAASVAAVSAGVNVIEGPVLQGSLGVVKLGGLDMTAGAKNFFTFRVTGANGEQFDRTIVFTALDDRSQVFGKDPDDQRFFAFDFSSDVNFGGTSLASIEPPVIVGVTALSALVIQGNLAIIKIGGLNQADGAENSCTLTATLANTEKVNRAIYFMREDH